MKIARVNPIPVNKAPATIKVRSRPGRAEPVFTTECLAQRTGDRVRPRGGHVALLVESDGYLAHPANPASNWDGNGRGADIPGSTAKRLREEYTVSPDGRYLLLNLTVEHRVYLSVAFEPFACDLESARRSSGNAVR